MWRHLLVNSFLLLISLAEWVLHMWNIASFSWLHRWHLGVPKVGTQDMGLACQDLWIFTVLRINLFGGFGKFCNTSAKCEANVVDFFVLSCISFLA